MNDLTWYTPDQLTELRDRIHDEAQRLFERASEITRRQMALPSFTVPGVLEQWQELRAEWKTANAAGQEKLEMLTDIAAEYRRRAQEASHG